MKRFLFIFILCCLSAPILFFSGCKQPAKTVKVKVITITDVHAAIFPYDFIRDTLAEAGFAHLQTYLEEQRSDAQQDIILLDNGDLLQGQPSGYYSNFIADRPVNLFADVLNDLGFDAASVGNHDIETGHEVYDRIRTEFDFPWLAANVIDVESGNPYFMPYTILERQGVKIAVLGLVTSSVPGWLPRKLWEGLRFDNMLESATYWMQYIQENEKPDAVIGLFHSGAGEESYSSGESPENASMLVGKNVPGFDVIFTGHDHRERNLIFKNNEGKDVIMISGKSHGRSVAVVDLVFERNDSARYTIGSIQSELVELNQFAASESFMATYQTDFDQVAEFINQKIGYLEKDLYSREAYKGNAAFVDFIHDMQLELTGADVSFAAPLSFDAVLQKGDLTMRDMFRLYPFENYLYVMELTGEEIRKTLEYSYGLWFTTMQNENDNILNLRKEEQGNVALDDKGRARFVGPFYNFDSAAGIDYVVDVSKPAGSRISIMQKDETFDPEKIYKVAVNSYRGSGGGGHLVQGAGINHEELEDRIIWVSEKDLRSHIADYIRSKNVLAPEAGNNWSVVPQQWYQKAIERDFKLLFPD
jgi:2',3'-cyclic-nucleotide 2'-phosphodiesterase / 3'-nucleotidase